MNTQALVEYRNCFNKRCSLNIVVNAIKIKNVANKAIFIIKNEKNDGKLNFVSIFGQKYTKQYRNFAHVIENIQ